MYQLLKDGEKVYETKYSPPTFAHVLLSELVPAHAWSITGEADIRERKVKPAKMPQPPMSDEEKLIRTERAIKGLKETMYTFATEKEIKNYAIFKLGCKP